MDLTFAAKFEIEHAKSWIWWCDEQSNNKREDFNLQRMGPGVGAIWVLVWSQESKLDGDWAIPLVTGAICVIPRPWSCQSSHITWQRWPIM